MDDRAQQIARQFEKLSRFEQGEAAQMIERLTLSQANPPQPAAPPPAGLGHFNHTTASPVRVAGLTLDNVEECFSSPSNDAFQYSQRVLIGEALIAAAKVILRQVPPCADRSTALRKLREVRMDANSAITHRGQF